MEKTPLTKKHVIEEIEIYLNATEINYQVIQKTSNRIYRRTTRIIKTVFISIGLLLVANIYFIYDFRQGIVTMTSSMTDMYDHFGNMHNQVHGITESVVKMTNHIDVLPSMNESMTSMDHTLVNINADVQFMQVEVGLMSKDVGSINHNITDMTYRFDQVNDNMNKIGDSVHQMSRSIP